MYKKITHHIVEEHFDHPIAAELKKKVDKTATTTPINPKPTFHSSKKTNTTSKGWIHTYDFSPLSLVEKRSLNRWACLNWRIRSLVISITEGDDDLDLLKARMANDITKISELLIECYGEDAAKTFRKLLTNIVLSLSEVLLLVKADQDTTTAMITLADATKAFGDFAESANSAWPSKAVVDIFTQVENLYIMQAISRIKKEWAAGVDAADNAYDIMVVEQDNGDPSFADIFSAGILACMENTIENVIEENTDYMET
jgi:hypothetical protein